MTAGPKLAMVIGSGGIKCAASIGVMQVLEEAGIAVDMVVGCSGGAVFGAGIALGFTSEKLSDAHAKSWTPDIARKLDFRSLLKIVSPKLMGFDDTIGIFDDSAMIANLVLAFGAETTFDDTKIPFYCVATDFHTGEQVLISEGGIVQAIRISSGIPLAFRPVEWQGRLLTDGGISNPLPVDVAIQQGADIIIAVGFETHLGEPVSSPAGFAMQMFYILGNQLLYKRFAFFNLAYHSEMIAIVPDFEGVIALTDVNSTPYIIQQGRTEMLKHLGYLKQLLAAANSGSE